MRVDWIDLVILLAFASIMLRYVEQKIRGLQAEVRRLEIRCNTHEMNVAKLYYLRDIETHQSNLELSMEDQRMLKEDLDDQLATLADRNRWLMDQTASGQ